MILRCDCNERDLLEICGRDNEILLKMREYDSDTLYFYIYDKEKAVELANELLRLSELL